MGRENCFGLKKPLQTYYSQKHVANAVTNTQTWLWEHSHCSKLKCSRNQQTIVLKPLNGCVLSFVANSQNTPTQVFGTLEQTAWPTSLTAPRGTVCWACCAGPLNSALSSPLVPPWLRACKMSSPGMTFTTRPQYGVGPAGMYGLFSWRWMATEMWFVNRLNDFPKRCGSWGKGQLRLTDVNQVPAKEMLSVDVLGWMVLLLPELIQMQ